ncbi:HSP20 family protein [Anoxybacillus mongoliensis]|uniref:HSP20 family protein n=1 Tax=Anoxybacillus mongoliensis TaxID=452565 RepID=A0A7W8JF14_9BACL|nr:Hsp20/alpha crystallin family protein [Anoxybacillus mongoliensis]MBB5355851.1 HSP20 family protein [Anoxybacillus mongoliensis]MCX8001208.1 Hsp20/alpha crystallin family protein [Anoxybacillus mongoliensis]
MDPFRSLDVMRRDIERMFSNFPSLFSHVDDVFRMPRVDVHENEKEMIVTCDIPGLERKEDVDIHIDHQTLSISGHVRRQHDVHDEHMHRQERFYGRFHRTIPLPSPATHEHVQASYKNGVLEIRIPKAQADDKKRIDIQFH